MAQSSGIRPSWPVAETEVDLESRQQAVHCGRVVQSLRALSQDAQAPFRLNWRNLQGREYLTTTRLGQSGLPEGDVQRFRATSRRWHTLEAKAPCGVRYASNGMRNTPVGHN